MIGAPVARRKWTCYPLPLRKARCGNKHLAQATGQHLAHGSTLAIGKVVNEVPEEA